MKQAASMPQNWRKAGYIIIGFLILVVMVLSAIQLWVMYSTTDMSAYGSVQADQNGWPSADERGAFIMLTEPHNPLYAGPLVELLATSDPGVVDQKSGAHFLPSEVKSILVQSSIVSEGKDYHVYRIGVETEDAMDYARQSGGHVMIIQPKKGTWEPGAYIVDTPSDGMFGGRTYYQFYVDPQQ